MGKIKALILGFVKPLILAHVADLSQLAPMLSATVVAKTNLTKDQADALSKDLIDVVESEIIVLVNKM